MRRPEAMNRAIAHSVAKNTTVQFAQQLMTWASSFLLMLFLPRMLGPISYGHIYLAMTIAGIFILGIEYDGRLGIAKRIAKAPEDAPRILSNSFGFRIIFWAIAFSTLIAFGYYAHYPAAVRWLILLFGLDMLWSGGKTVLLGLFLGFESVQYSSVGAIAERAFISLFGVSALLLGANEFVIAGIMIAGTLLNFSILAFYTRRFVTSLPRISWNETIALLKDGFPYLLYSIFGIIYYRIDTIMLSMSTPEVVVGWYGASYKFLDVLMFLPSIFTLSLLPVMTKLQKNDGNMLERTTQKSLDFILIAVYPISICMFALAPKIIRMFFGLEGYTPSIVNLQIFAFGLPLIYIDMVLGTAIFACDKQLQWAVTAFFAAVVNIGLNLLLIPYFQLHTGNGGIGAAIATIVTEFFVMLNALYLLPAGMLKPGSNTVTWKSFGAGISLGLSFWIMTLAGVPWYLTPVIGIFIYGGTLLSFRTFEPSELAFIKQFLSLKSLRSTFSMGKGTGQ
jgi:O-antigen/teichoic acid export membrane protein